MQLLVKIHCPCITDCERKYVSLSKRSHMAYKKEFWPWRTKEKSHIWNLVDTLFGLLSSVSGSWKWVQFPLFTFVNNTLVFSKGSPNRLNRVSPVEPWESIRPSPSAASWAPMRGLKKGLHWYKKFGNHRNNVYKLKI